MPCGFLNWVLEQKKDVGGKTGEIRIQFGVQLIVMYRCWFLSFDNCSMVMEDVDSRENTEGCVELSVQSWQLFCN